MFLYLDRHGNRYDAEFSLSPLIIRCDLEDFIRQLVEVESREIMVISEEELLSPDELSVGLPQ